MKINPVGWFEIYVADMGRARKFYESLFDVTLTRLPHDTIEVWQFPSDPQVGYGCGGALLKMEGVIPSGVGTVVYFKSDDCSIEEKNIESLGGKIHRPKMSIGEYGHIVLATDTEGNMFGVHSMS